eukprot:6427078-Prymnesium_polylepis.1
MAELGGRGWYSFCEFLPSVPWRGPPRGSAKRKDGGPPRGIVDQGGPRKQPFYTRWSRENVYSLNERSKAA